MLVYGVFATAVSEPWAGVVHGALSAEAAAGKIRYRNLDNIGYSGRMERTLRDVARKHNPKVIFGDAFGNEEAVRKVAKEFPKVAFVFGSAMPETPPNLAVFNNWIHDPAYLAGMLAGGMTKSGHLGVVAGYAVPEVNRVVNAYLGGAKSIRPDVQVKVSYINSWLDPGKAEQAAQAQIDAGADVLFAERTGVVEAAEENGVLAITSMAELRDESSDSVLTSIQWDMRPTVRAVIDQVKKDTFAAVNLKDFSLLKNGGSALAPINTGIEGAIPPALSAKVEAKLEQMKSGRFVTPVTENPPPGSIEIKS